MKFVCERKRTQERINSTTKTMPKRISQRLDDDGDYSQPLASFVCKCKITTHSTQLYIYRYNRTVNIIISANKRLSKFSKRIQQSQYELLLIMCIKRQQDKSNSNIDDHNRWQKQKYCRQRRQRRPRAISKIKCREHLSYFKCIKSIQQKGYNYIYCSI